jgi:hypothetical protein
VKPPARYLQLPRDTGQFRKYLGKFLIENFVVGKIPIFV